tara:strand:+ start:3419 stop:4327 length:909 start_codon:yes stop_codon:yes gene_type:complete
MAGDVVAWRQGFEDSAEFAEGPLHTYTETFIATLKTKFTSPIAIAKYSKCPKPGDRHKDDPTTYVSRVKPTRIGFTRIWKVVVEWTSESLSGSNELDPLKRPAVITVATEVEDVTTLFEANGRLRINSAGDLVPGIRKKTFQIFRIEKNVAQIPDWFLDWPGSINKYDFPIEGKIHPARTMLLLPIERPKQILENGVWHYPLVYSLRRDKDTYDVPEPSMGFHELYPVVELVKGKYITKFRKQRITVGTPPEYPKEKQFLDKSGFLLDLKEDKKKGGIDLSQIYIQYRRDLIEEDFRILPVT